MPARSAGPDALAGHLLDMLALSGNPDLDAVLDRIIRAARQLLGVRYAALGVPDGRGGFERFLTAGISERRAQQIGELPRTHGVLGALLDEGPILVDDIRRHPRFSYFPRHHPEMTDFLGVPITHRGEVLGNLFLSGRPSRRFGARDQRTVETLAGYAGVAIANARLYARAQELAVVEERNRVARELHDAASQRLFSLVYEARAGAIAAEGARSRRAMAALEEHAAEALHELRGLVYALRPKSLERDGLAATLGDHVEALRRTLGADIVLEAEGELGLGLDEEHALLRIAQEAIHNALRHGRGARARASVQRRGDEVTLRVADSGPGFDPGALPRTRRSMGLATMRQRAQEIGAELSLSSRPGSGTTVEVRLPARRDGGPPRAAARSRRG